MRMARITSYETSGNELVLHLKDGAVAGISFAGGDIMRLRFNQGSELVNDPDGFVVEKVPSSVPFELVKENGGVRLITELAQVVVNFHPACIRAYHLDGRPIFATKESAMGEAEENRSVLRVDLGRSEGIYGLGQDPMGNINQNGHERRMWNEWGGLHVAANAALPFYLSDKGYGLLLNNGWPSRFAVGEAKVSDPPPAHSIQRSKGPWDWGINSGEEDPDDLTLILENGRMDVFVVLRQGEKAIEGYSELTGYAPMPPKWALGYMQSKNRYRSDDEFVKLGKRFRELGIPCDTLVMDWLWFKQFGDLEWDREYWKDPEGMLKRLHELGFHIMQAYHPFIYEDSQKVEEFRAKGYLMNTPPDTLPIFDQSNPQAREEWWQQTKRLVEQGVDAYWIDMGEPRDHPQGTTCHLGSREHVHNLYALLWAKSLYDGHSRDLKTRPFQLSRTSYAGIQRYGAALWSNDIDSSWEVLRDQVPVGIGVCSSGLPYWCTDIGGFATDERYSPELFIRWLQWGVFCPLMRTHGTRAENEPWSYGEQAGEIIAQYIRLRYQLMPYIYACAREITDSGKPMLRGLFLDYPTDPIACAQKYEYMFGPALLVAPVLERDARQREVYLPKGEWYDYWTDKKLTGGRTILAQAPLGRIPLYVKAGSLIPMAEAVQFVGEKAETEIIVHAYGAEGRCMIYDDAGEGLEYQQSGFAKTDLTLWDGVLTAVLVEGDAKYIPHGRSYTLVNHHAKPAQNLTWHFDWDQTMDDVSRVFATADADLSQVEVEYEMTVPQGLTLIDAPCYFRKTPLAKGRKVFRGVAALAYVFAPSRTGQQLCYSAELTLTYTYNGKQQVENKHLTWGYGYVKEAQVIGFFEPEDAQDAALMARIESGDYQDSYPLVKKQTVADASIDDGELSTGGAEDSQGQQRVYWNHCLEATCFGYMDFRAYGSKKMIKGRGAGYARFVVNAPMDMDCKLEYSADRSFDLWQNGEKVYSKEGIQLKQIPQEALKLKQGENVFLVRCFVDYPEQRSGREIGFSMRFVTLDKEVCQGLRLHA